MPEYIEREKIGLTDFEIAMCNGDYKEGMKMLLDKIASIPAADVRPVVLCRDCKNYIERSGACAYLVVGMREDDFCSRGEKREES